MTLTNAISPIASTTVGGGASSPAAASVAASAAASNQRKRKLNELEPSVSITKKPKVTGVFLKVEQRIIFSTKTLCTNSNLYTEHFIVISKCKIMRFRDAVKFIFHLHILILK